jgi:hypothetical protein
MNVSRELGLIMNGKCSDEQMFEDCCSVQEFIQRLLLLIVSY